MKKKETEKRVYMEPVCKLFTIDAEQLLQTASGNAGMIGPGTSGGDAKRGQLEDEEENEFFEDDIESAWKIK